jgi:hypothetical protein
MFIAAFVATFGVKMKHAVSLVGARIILLFVVLTYFAAAPLIPGTLAFWSFLFRFRTGSLFPIIIAALVATSDVEGMNAYLRWALELLLLVVLPCLDTAPLLLDRFLSDFALALCFRSSSKMLFSVRFSCKSRIIPSASCS